MLLLFKFLEDLYIFNLGVQGSLFYINAFSPLMFLLQDNFKLMCTNAMIYNKPETIYYKAAKKRLHLGMKILRHERIQSLKQSIDFMADLQKTQKQEDRTDTSQSGEDRGCWPRRERTLEMPKHTPSRVPAKKIKRKTKTCLKVSLKAII